MSDWSERRCEAKIEETLIAGAKALGGFSLKVAPISYVGLLDRIILLPGGRVAFVEVKHPGQRPTPRQLWWIDRLRALGFRAEWLDSHAKAEALLADLELAWGGR